MNHFNIAHSFLYSGEFNLYVRLVFFSCIYLFTNSISNAQAPSVILYQAVARDNAGVAIGNQNISIRFSIHQATASGGRYSFKNRTTPLRMHWVFLIWLLVKVLLFNLHSQMSIGQRRKIFRSRIRSIQREQLHGYGYYPTQECTLCIAQCKYLLVTNSKRYIKYQ